MVVEPGPVRGRPQGGFAVGVAQVLVDLRVRARAGGQQQAHGEGSPDSGRMAMSSRGPEVGWQGATASPEMISEVAVW